MKNLLSSTIHSAFGAVRPRRGSFLVMGAGFALAASLGAAANAQEAAPAPGADDPIVAGEVARLKDLDLILRQSKIGEDILILDREVARAEALKALIAEIGPDGFRAAYPELAAALENSPMMLRAEKDVAELAAEIQALTAPPSTEAPKASVPGPRSDGSDLLRGTPAEAVAEAEIPEIPDPAPPTIAEAPNMAEAPILPPDPPSLREIHGLSGNFQAVVTQGSERMLVMKGDTLPGGLLVKEIGESWIELGKDDETVRLNIRG